MHNILKFITIIFLIILTGCISDNEVLPSHQEGIFAKDALLQDFDQLVDIIKSSPPKAFTDMSKFAHVAESQRLKISDMSRYEFYKLLAPVVAAVDCGHTKIKYPVGYLQEERYYFPFAVKVINSELYIFKNSYNTNIPEGSKIHSINNRDSAEIIDILYSSMPSDGSNETRKEFQLNQNFSDYYHNYFEAPEQFRISYTAPGGTDLITEVIEPNKSKFIMEDAPGLDNYFFTENYAVLRVKYFKYMSSKTIDSFFTTLKQNGSTNLILDLRGNPGGFADHANILLSYLMDESFYFYSDDQEGFDHLALEKTVIKENAFKGKLFIMTDGGCFSSTGFVLSHLKNNPNVTIVGQESGGGYKCNGYAVKERLQNTQIALINAQVVGTTSVEGLESGRGVMPDIEVNYTIEDYLLGKDLEFERILEMINSL
ncbi:MAG: S41 family peptidase [Spirochaetales bacterium]|nr:S41 family peptidase [Spirochaetales bacterium]